MSDINIKLTIDDSQANTDLDKLDQKRKQGQVASEKDWNTIRTNFMYFTQLSSIIFSNLARAAEGTEGLATIQALQLGQTAVVGTIAAFQTGLQAKAAFLQPVPNLFAGFSLAALAVLLEASVGQSVIAQIQSMRLAREAAEIRRQFDAYNI